MKQSQTIQTEANKLEWKKTLLMTSFLMSFQDRFEEVVNQIVDVQKSPVGVQIHIKKQIVQNLLQQHILGVDAIANIQTLEDFYSVMRSLRQAGANV